MTMKLVKLKSVESNTEITKRDGGTYTGALLVYESDGRMQQKGIHSTVLKNHPELASKIQGLEGKAGQEVTLNLEKKGNFWNIIDILPASAATSGGGFNGGSSGGRGSFTRKGGSMQDTARIARSTAIQAAATVATTGDEVLELAEKFAAFIVAPLSIDSSGVSLATDFDEAEEEGDGDGTLPF